MAGEDGFSDEELRDLIQRLDSIVVQFPNETKKFLRQEAGKGVKLLRAETKAKTQKKTGNLLKGIGKGKPYIYNGDEHQIRFRNSAKHAQLIDFGHDITKVLVEGSGGAMIPVAPKDVRKAQGKYIVKNTGLQFRNTFEKDIDEFVDEMLEAGLR